jgi:antitoxin component of RelBE/YafQ-DinJ toxin-antitoxin module
MTAEMTQLNVRMPKELKTNVDEVLRRNKVTSSEYIRSVWTFIQDEQYLPDLQNFGESESSCASENDEDAEKNARLEAFKNRPGIQDMVAEYLGVNVTDLNNEEIPFKELKEMAMDEWYEEKLARCTL